MTRRNSRRAQSGVTIVVTLVLLVVMLLGGMALARLTEAGTLAAGNAAYHEAAVQASEVGVNTAYLAVRALANEEQDSGAWYFATRQASVDGGPDSIGWGTLPEVTVGNYSVRYIVDRLCSGALPIADPVRQCLSKAVIKPGSRSVGSEPPDPITAKQFRVTVRVTGPKGTQTWVQSLVTKG